jgi:hypothetical protein
VRLTAFKEGAYFMGMKIFNHLPTNIKILSNRVKLFKPVLKNYLLRQSFYSLEEYFSSVHNIKLLVIELLCVCINVLSSNIVVWLLTVLIFNCVFGRALHPVGDLPIYGSIE